MSPRLPSVEWRDELEVEHITRKLEGELIEQARTAVTTRAQSAPTNPDDFVTWFEALEKTGPGQHDRLFPWLAATASLDQMRWFLRQEVAGEAGFEDLVALTQLRIPSRPKLELARNYWDELGRGDEGGMHGPMLTRLAHALDLESLEKTVPVVCESVALGNIMLGLAANRRYAYHALGALGVIELTAPARAALVNRGLKRLQIAGPTRRYFALHATLDIKHSAAWNAEVLHPIVAADPRTAIAIAEGAVMRLEAGRRCFERYRRELGVDQIHPSRPSSASPVARSVSPISLR